MDNIFKNLEPILFNISYLGYSLSTVLYMIYAITKNEKWANWGLHVIYVSICLHISNLIMRAYIGLSVYQLTWYVPWSNWFESFSLFTLLIGIIFVIIHRYYRIYAMGVFILPLLWIIITFSMAYPFMSGAVQQFDLSSIWIEINRSRSIPKLMPALQSYWMAIHVPTMFISYSIFSCAFSVGIIYLFREQALKRKKHSIFMNEFPALEKIDQLVYRLIGFGFPILTLGILLGARWAYDAWGRYWGWDAKETWALISWLVYAIYLHMRLVKNWIGRKSVLLSMLGFIVILFTYVGVNYLSDLHGFLSGRGA